MEGNQTSKLADVTIRQSGVVDILRILLSWRLLLCYCSTTNPRWSPCQTTHDPYYSRVSVLFKIRSTLTMSVNIRLHFMGSKRTIVLVQVGYPFDCAQGRLLRMTVAE